MNREGDVRRKETPEDHRRWDFGVFQAMEIQKKP